MTIDAAPDSSATPAMRQAVQRSDGTPVVFDAVRARGPDGISFDVWYCNTHLPALAGAHPTRRLRRYAAPSRGLYVAIGELDALAATARESGTDNDLGEGVQRFVGDPLGTQRRADASKEAIESAILYPALLRVPQDRMGEISRWYEEEHLPMLLACPQWVMTRRFRVTEARSMEWTHVALHYLTDLRALASPERDRARDTKWRDWIKAEGWFTPEYWVCYRLQDT